MTSAVNDAISGLDGARDGISTIAQAIVTGQNAPPEARDQVAQGLGTVQSALDSITSYVFLPFKFLNFDCIWLESAHADFMIFFF